MIKDTEKATSVDSDLAQEQRPVGYAARVEHAWLKSISF
jgi:hypothetical protein